MPNCLGVYVEKNLIKYAKVSKDKTSSLFKVLSYGVKFYENLEETVKSIINETNSTADELCMNITRELYVDFNVFSNLKPKDIKDLLKTEFESYCAENGMIASSYDMRYSLVKNTSSSDRYKAICVSANKAELSGVWQMFEKERLKSLSSIAFSITNILKDKGLGEQCAVVNIEDETTLTVITKGEIAGVVTIPLGMQDIISRLSERLNSYAKAYEACKSVTITFDSADSFSDEQRQAMELILPTMYDLRERVKRELEVYGSEIRKVYLTGTGVLVNNIDVYFEDAFDSQTCEVLNPFFVNKDASNVRDIIEVNSATALAMNGLGYIDKKMDFYFGEELGGAIAKKRLKEFASKETLQKIGDWFASSAGFVKRKSKSTDSKDKTTRAKPNVEFDENSGSGVVINSNTDTEETIIEDEKVSFSLDSLDKWFIRLAATLGIALVAYCVLSVYSDSVIQGKIKEVNNNIDATNKEIADVETDITYIKNQGVEYKTKTDKLYRIIDKIRIMSQRSFDIPNFMSQLMFIVPEDVKVTSLQITTDKKVELYAQSGKYAKLGYFVSRLKLENALKNVDMEVLSMNSDIKIKISGELP